MNDHENSDHTANAALKKEILEFYSGGVSNYYAERCIDFYHQKKKAFNWLFDGEDRIKLSVSDEEAAMYFFDHNPDFQHLVNKTVEFLYKEDFPLLVEDVKLAIYRNKITFQKNVYKFTKFYNRYVRTENDPEFDFQRFYDRLKTAECVISIHPMDFIGASEDSSFSSCLAIDSCHHTATTAYLRDDFTVMAYTTDGKKKIGRQFIYFDCFYIIMGNIYGAISKPLQEKIRKYIEEKYAKYLEVSNKWVISRNKTISEDNLYNCGHSNNDHGEFSVYFDQAVSAAIRYKEKTDNFDDLSLDFEDGLDRYGDSTSSGYIGLRYCSCCEETVDGELTYTEDGEVCDYCLNNYYTYCYECERYYYENTPMYYIEDENHHICESCYNDNDYGFCEKTEAYYSRDKLMEVIDSDGNLMIVHEDYAAEHFHFCDSCEKYFEKSTTETSDGFCVCNLCLDKDYELIDGSYEFKSRQVA
ncbi:MAG: hypothetical protein K9G38_06435 [Bacteroidales bacterium]|nr:hypothetical protein [Bacteroidales bacterium]